MKRVLIAISLAVVQLVFAAILLTIGGRQTPQNFQDYPPFVGSATKMCQAINAPAALLEASLLALFAKLGIRLSSLTWDLFFLASLALIWFLIGLEIEKLLKKDNKLPISIGCIGVSVGIALMLFGHAAWQEGEIGLMIGSAAWGLVLMVVYGWRLVLIMSSRTVASS